MLNYAETMTKMTYIKTNVILNLVNQDCEQPIQGWGNQHFISLADIAFVVLNVKITCQSHMSSYNIGQAMA